MAAIQPTDLFPSYTSDGTNITIPIASLVGLSAAEANATTGDGRAVLASLLETSYQGVQSLETADRPTKMTLTKTAPTTVAGSINSVRQGYTASFDYTLVPSDLNLVSEV